MRQQDEAWFADTQEAEERSELMLQALRLHHGPDGRPDIPPLLAEALARRDRILQKKNG